MAIDILSADRLTLAEACQLVPPARKNTRPHLSTVLRWITEGAPGPNGDRVRLAAVRFGGRWITSRQALRDFAKALTPRRRARRRQAQGAGHAG
jgi:hypothetical protein